jgi:NifU-like protein involved in Fe-S cluster formation
MKKENNKWFYSAKVKEHFFNPKNIFKSQEEAKKYKADGIGMVGNPKCGDMMKMWIKVDKKTQKIKECKYQTFGCASAIATTSVLSEMVKGKKLDDAVRISPKDIVDKLGGLPQIKFHCSVLGDKALREAINDYYRKTDQIEKIITDSPIVDETIKITERDIENAVIDGARNLKQVQEKTKVGLTNPKILPKVEDLIKKFKEKHGLK